MGHDWNLDIKLSFQTASVVPKMQGETCTCSKVPEMTELSPFQRINPSAEMVMIDRMFNQEERASLSRDKRLALVDPGKTARVEVEVEVEVKVEVEERPHHSSGLLACGEPA